MTRYKRIVKISFALALVLFTLLSIWNLFLGTIYEDDIFSDLSKVPAAQVALVPGASVYPSKKPSPVLLERLDRAIELYRNKKVKKLLLSGDHSDRYYDEVNAMKNYCLKKNVKPKDIFLDHSGLRTFDSMYRARYIFQVRSMVIVSQGLYLPRAIFLGKNFGLTVSGYSADMQKADMTSSMKFREFLARYLAAFDIYIFDRKPRFLGKPTPIHGDGQVTWDKKL